MSHWHFLISSYYLTVSNLLSLTALKSKEFTLSSGSFTQGGISTFESQWQLSTVKRSLYGLPVLLGGISVFECQWQHWTVKRSLCALSDIWGGILWDVPSVTLTFRYIFLLVEVSHWHFLISSYYLTVSNLLSLTALKSKEFTLSSGSIKWGDILLDVPGVTQTFPYIFLLFDCFKWALIDYIEKQRVHSELWQFQMGAYIIRCTWCDTDILLYLPISWGVTLTFPYIFLLLDCFEFALIDRIEKQRAHSELWQFWMWGIL